MGKRRRTSPSPSSSSSSDDEARILRKKLRKLKRKYRKYGDFRRGRSGYNSPDADGNKENRSNSSYVPSEAGDEPIEPSLELGESSQSPSGIFLPVRDGDLNDLQNTNDPLAVEEVVPLDENILKLLGSENSAREKSALSIHHDLAVRWELVLKGGLEETIRSDLINKYPPVKNCTLMAAPKLNLEVKAAISESCVKRDERLAKVQSQVGASLSALGRALSLLFENKEGGEALNMELIEILSDSARLLADVHHQESQTRRNILSLTLRKDFASTLSDVTFDGWLFGENLGERVKTAKAIEQSGRELKAGDRLQKHKNIPPRSSLNSKGPSRYTVLGNRLGGQKHIPRSSRGGGSRRYTDYRASRSNRDKQRRTFK